MPSRSRPLPGAFIPGVVLTVVGLLCAGRVTATTCDPRALFGAPVNYTSGPNPAFLVSRDFNQDGIADLAVTNSDFQNGGVNNSVAIFIGQGGTSYALPVHYPVGLNPHMLAPGDFNEDGITDLVVANKWSSSVSVLLGQGASGVGNGTFAPAVSYPTGGYPFQLVVEDLDRDGILDVAASLNNVASVALLRGHGSGGVGDGTFTLVGSLPIASVSTGLERGDFNGDGITDLVATENLVGTVAMLLGTGSAVLDSASFQPALHIPGGPLPFELAVADFNEDGKQDLAVAEQIAGGGTRILLGDGHGTFQAPTTLPTGNTVGVITDDLDQDGITDLAIAIITGFDTGEVRVFLGQGSGGVGDGTFGSSTAYGSGGDAYQLLPGDFDGDGHRDLVVSYYLRDIIALLPGQCGPPPAPDPRYPVLTDVRDVPNDQGGRVFLTWTHSSLDTSGGPVNAYRVWRRIPPALVEEWLTRGTMGPGVLARPARASSTRIEYWEPLATLPAQRLAGYGYTAPTTQDSISGSNPFTAFFVTALTPNIDVFYSSNADSGYSVDNLPPPQPQPFVAQFGGAQVALHWGESGAADFGEYRLYRGPDAEFVPTPGNLVLATGETDFVDSSPAAASSYYKLTAVDTHGNQSNCAVVSPPLVTGVGSAELQLALRPPVPNPSDGRSTTVDLTLSDAGPARLELVDVAGRVVLARDVGSLGPGIHRVDLARREPLRTGLYFIRLTRGRTALTARLAVVR